MLTKADIESMVQKSLFDDWKELFWPLLGHTPRWEGFSYIIKDQLERDVPCILETGTLRNVGAWRNDGQSTRLWNWLLEHKKGFGASVDLDWQAVQVASVECPKVSVVCQDSVSFLRGFLPVELTLLYLDSKDASGDVRPAAVHQLAELAAIWDRLPSGCLIASDDNAGPGRGKGAFVRPFLKAFDCEPVIDSYIVVWRKP